MEVLVLGLWVVIFGMTISLLRDLTHSDERGSGNRGKRWNKMNEVKKTKEVCTQELFNWRLGHESPGSYALSFSSSISRSLKSNPSYRFDGQIELESGVPSPVPETRKSVRTVSTGFDGNLKCLDNTKRRSSVPHSSISNDSSLDLFPYLILVLHLVVQSTSDWWLMSDIHVNLEIKVTVTSLWVVFTLSSTTPKDSPVLHLGPSSRYPRGPWSQDPSTFFKSLSLYIKGLTLSSGGTLKKTPLLFPYRVHNRTRNNRGLTSVSWSSSHRPDRDLSSTSFAYDLFCLPLHRVSSPQGPRVV